MTKLTIINGEGNIVDAWTIKQIFELIKSEAEREKYCNAKELRRLGQFSSAEKITNTILAFMPAGVLEMQGESEILKEYGGLTRLTYKITGDNLRSVRHRINSSSYTYASFLSGERDSIVVLVKNHGAFGHRGQYRKEAAEFYDTILSLHSDDRADDIDVYCLIGFDAEAYFNEHSEMLPTSAGSPLTANKTQLGNHTYPLKKMVDRYQNEPPPVFVWKGIKKGSFGFFVGPAKSGKSTLCENLAQAIATGAPEFLGHPIGLKCPVFLAFLEEHWTNRTARLQEQISSLPEEEKKICLENIKTIDEHFPRVINDETSWDMLENAIKESAAGVVIVDSLSRFTGGKIEESSEASKIVLRLRNLAEKYRVTMIVIHHTPKQGGRPLTIESLAGSRVLGAEADFIIGINRVKNFRYIKDVAFRYCPEDSEAVQCFDINDTRTIVPSGNDYEDSILKAAQNNGTDPQPDEDEKAAAICSYLKLAGAEPFFFVSARDLIQNLVVNKVMSRASLFAKLKSLSKKGLIEGNGKGEYRIKPQEPA